MTHDRMAAPPTPPSAGYGLSHSQFLALLDAQPALFTHAGLFNAGAVILQLKALGMTDATIHASILARCVGEQRSHEAMPLLLILCPSMIHSMGAQW